MDTNELLEEYGKIETWLAENEPDIYFGCDSVADEVVKILNKWASLPVSAQELAEG